MRLLRVFILIVLLICVLAGAAGFIYLETIAKRDLQQWLSSALKTNVRVSHVVYHWPLGIKLNGVTLSNTAAVDKVMVSFSREELQNCLKEWFQKTDTVVLPARIRWKNFRAVLSQQGQRENDMNEKINEMLREFKSDGNIRVLFSIARDDRHIRKLSFEGKVITGGK